MREKLLPELLSLRPPAGVLCNRRRSSTQSSLCRQVVGSAAWHKSRVSKFELQEHF